MAPMSPLNSPSKFLSSHLQSTTPFNKYSPACPRLDLNFQRFFYTKATLLASVGTYNLFNFHFLISNHSFFHFADPLSSPLPVSGGSPKERILAPRAAIPSRNSKHVYITYKVRTLRTRRILIWNLCIRTASPALFSTLTEQRKRSKIMREKLLYVPRRASFDLAGSSHYIALHFKFESRQQLFPLFYMLAVSLLWTKGYITELHLIMFFWTLNYGYEHSRFLSCTNFFFFSTIQQWKW